METRANYALIGFFTLAAIAAAFGFVYWFSGKDAGAGRQFYRIVFSGSISGLSRGASVLFNGVRVGEVSSIDLVPQDPRRVSVLVAVDPRTPMRGDTRAKLEFQGFTGLASIQLNGGDASSQPLQTKPGEPVPTIFAERSDFQDVLELVRNIGGRVDQVVMRFDKFIEENEGPLGRTVRNVESFSQALSNNSAGVDRFLASTANAAERISALATRLDAVSGDIDQFVKAIEPQRVSRIVANVESFSQAVGGNREQVEGIMRDTAALAKRLNESSGTLDQTLKDLSALLKGVETAKVSRSIDNIDRFAQSLGAGSPNVEKALKDVSEITGKLNASANRIDGVLASAEKFLGGASGEGGLFGGDTKQLFADVGEAAKAIRKLADNLDKRTQEITSGINRFTGSGARDLEAVASDGRKTLQEINRTLRSLEKNPQQLIFGAKPAIPDYSGR